MGQTKGALLPVLFIVAVISLSLPFMAITSVMGMGEVFSGLEMFSDSDYTIHPFVLAYIAVMICGVILFFWKSRVSRILQTLFALAGAASVIALRIGLVQYMQGTEHMGVSLEWRVGYYGALFSLIGATIYSIYLLFDRSSTLPVPTPTLAPMDLICPHCHKGNEAGSSWCSWCGGSMTASSSPAGPICPHCQKANESNSAWCQWCGGKIGGQVQPAANMCPHCGKGNEPGSKFCYWCGGSMSVSADSSPAQPSLYQGGADVGFSPTVPLTVPVMAEVDAGPIPFLRVQRVGRWELIPILKNEFIVGTDPVCSDYIEHSGNLGQSHAMIVKENDTFSISKSSEGVVQVNNQPVLSAQKCPLNPGDIISMGDVEYVFDLA